MGSVKVGIPRFRQRSAMTSPISVGERPSCTLDRIVRRSFLGVVIGGIVMAMFMPIFELSSVID
jgi:hypothetical protein